MHRKSTLLVLFALLALFATAAQAQFNYQITSTPTAVINVGRAEPLGSVRITSIGAAGGTSVASTVQILYQGIQCDNNQTSGVAVVAPAGTIFPIAAGGPIQTSLSVTNTSGGCTVQFTIPGGLVAPAPGTDYLEVQGVRGRVDISSANIPNTDVTAVLNATPANSSLFTAPTQVRVATSAIGRFISFGPSTALLCVTTPPGKPTITVTEGFNAAFVQHVAVTSAGAVLHAVPANARPVSGATNNTEIHINIGTLPAGVTLGWPDFVPSDTVPGSGLALLPTTTHPGDNNQTSLTYTYVTTDQGLSDVALESFSISPTVTVASASLGTATASVLLYPPLEVPDATPTTGSAAPTPPYGPGSPPHRPRFNDTPVSGTFLTIAPCTTNLLFPYVATSVAGFDTGIAISNTTSDIWGTGAQVGKCHINYFPAGPGAVITYDTPTVASGDTITFLTTGNAASAGTVGYIIARCDFQFAHGLAYLVNSFGQTPNTSIGYLALVIPDPVTIGNAFNAGVALRQPNPAPCSALAPGVCLANTGENLGQ